MEFVTAVWAGLAAIAFLVLLVLLLTGRMYRNEPHGFPLDRVESSKPESAPPPGSN